MSDDFGPYGKGLDGYVHYMQSFNETQKRGGGGGQRPSSSNGCFTSILLVLGVIGGVIAYILEGG